MVTRRPDLLHRAHELVAEVHARDRHRPVVQVQVAAADGGALDPQQQPVRARHAGVGHVLDGHVPLPVQARLHAWRRDPRSPSSGAPVDGLAAGRLAARRWRGENGRLPKNPLCADSGDGWADSMITWRLVSTRPRFLRADAPHRMNTTRSGLALTARITSSVKVSHPLPWWEAAWRARTVSVALRSSTPWRGPGVEAAVVGRVDAEVVVQLLEDVHERRRRRARPGRTEKHSPWAWPAPWYGSWPEDQHLHVGEGREVQGREHVVVRRVHGGAGPLVGHELLELGPVGLGELPRRTGFQSVRSATARTVPGRGRTVGSGGSRG